ncbi:MAG: hypothetical protein FJX36_11845 [Alphaproteobacteria bacterium]|nr:hypothetical protein [Alphaproteobacteria bacterium]
MSQKSSTTKSPQSVPQALTSDTPERESAVKNRENVASLLTPDQLPKAQELSRAWKPTPRDKISYARE